MKNRKFNGLVAYKRKLNYCIVSGGRRYYSFTKKEKKIRRTLYFYRYWNKLHFRINSLGIKTNFFPF